MAAKKKEWFIEYFHVKLSRTCHPYIMDFLEIFNSGKYNKDMKILKILASNSKRFRIYAIFNIQKIDDDSEGATRWTKATFSWITSA